MIDWRELQEESKDIMHNNIIDKLLHIIIFFSSNHKYVISLNDIVYKLFIPFPVLCNI